MDHELVRHYRPGQARMGILVQIAQRHHLQNIAKRNRHDLPLTAMGAVSEKITFPADI